MAEQDRISVQIHPTAEVDPGAELGHGCRVWNQAHVRSGVRIGPESTIGKNVYVDTDVTIGSRCKIQNNVSIYDGVTVDDGVFVGPHVCFTNDRVPRAINPDGSLKRPGDWQISRTLVRYGASIGAHSVVLPGLTVGAFALVAAGSVVTRDVPDHGLVMGSPARLVGYVCFCGARLPGSGPRDCRAAGATSVTCASCGRVVRLRASIGSQVGDARG